MKHRLLDQDEKVRQASLSFANKAGAYSNTTNRRSFINRITSALAGIGGGVLSAQSTVHENETQRITLPKQSNTKIVEVEPILIRGSRNDVWTLIKVRTNHGVTGIGEAFSINQAWASRLRENVRTIGSQIIGTPPQAISAFVQRFKKQANGHHSTSVIAGIEIALWDIMGKMTGKPVYALLGGPIRQRIPVYQTWGTSNLDETLESMIALKEKGVQMLKCDPFGFYLPWRTVDMPVKGLPEPEGIKKSMRHLARIRQAMGENYKIGVDAHWRFNVEGAKIAAKEMEPYQPVFFEEPTSFPNNPDHLLAVAESTSISISTGEHFETLEQAAKALSSGAISYIQPELAWNCGILESFKICSMAEGMGVQVATHGHVSPVAIRAASHINAAIPNLFYQEAPGISWQDWGEELLDPPTKVENGHILINDRPGLGFTLNEKMVQQRRLS